MAHQKRRTFLGRQQGKRRRVANHCDGKSTFQLFHCGLNGSSQLETLNQMLVGEVCNDFCIGVGLKNIAFRGERFSDFFVIFNDAVMHHAH